MNKIFILLLGSLTLLFLLGHCRTKPYGISDSGLAKIKETYSIEAINYFYEIVFFQDGKGTSDRLFKWENDVWIRMEGTLWPNDLLYINKAVEELNELDLPIKLHLTDDEALANITVYFGDNAYINEKHGRNVENASGVVSASNYENVQFAKIGILNDASSYNNMSPQDSAILRKGAILEEITQVLGVIGDSWLNYHSLFFEGRKSIPGLAEIDKEIIKLLYEPSIPATLTRSQFEAHFKDELYTVNSTEKLVDYIRANKVPKRYLEFIRDNSFHDSTLYKYPKHIFVQLEGDYQNRDLEFCQKAINLFNTVSDQFQLEIVKENIWTSLPIIVVEYKKSPLIYAQAERFLTPGGMMTTRRVQGSIKLTYGKPGITQENTDLLLFSAFYRILGLDHINAEIAKLNDAGEIEFREDYREILALLYNPVFPNELKQEELNGVIASSF